MQCKHLPLNKHGGVVGIGGSGAAVGMGQEDSINSGSGSSSGGSSGGTREELVSHLCDLFDRIDVNGDGVLEWREFTSFCVEACLVATRGHAALLRYKLGDTGFADSASRGPVTATAWAPALQRALVCEEDGAAVKLYDANTRLAAVIVPAARMTARTEPAPRRVPPSLLFPGSSRSSSRAGGDSSAFVSAVPPSASSAVSAASARAEATAASCAAVAASVCAFSRPPVCQTRCCLASPRPLCLVVPP